MTAGGHRQEYSPYEKEVAVEYALEAIAGRQGRLRFLSDVEVELGLAQATLHHWINTREDWIAAHADAKRAQAESCVRQGLEYALNGTVEETGRDTLRTKTLNWISTRLDPENWGDRQKVSLDLTGYVAALPAPTASVEVWQEESDKLLGSG